MPPISIIIAAYEQCDVLRRHLPAFLEQDYPSDYEVIVVDMNSSDDTISMLEGLQVFNPNLHIIRLPDSSRDVSPIRLALTLGARSASYEWLMLTQADCIPASSHWLSHMVSVCESRPELQIVLGQTRFVDGHGWNGLRCRFFRAYQQRLNLYHARQHGAYRCDGTNLCYRRSLFFEHRGFADHANLLTGATDIMVNQHSTAQNTAVCMHPDAIILQDTPQAPEWWNRERLFFMETRRHFRHTFRYRLRYFTVASLTWFCTLLLGAITVMGLVYHNYLAVGLSLFAWLLYMGYCTLSFNRYLKSIGEPPIIQPLPLLLHLVPYWDSTAWLHWLFSDKNNFKKRFI